ncbi:MAG: NUDIX domain-containing protein [Nanoarchaeota archaeon]|nr:NUDIX domain-containing protein [Nanoarchaeota archaeon]
MLKRTRAAKAFIVKEDAEDKLILIIKRRMDDVQRPGIWEVPGGRIADDEDLIAGLKRETKEETNLDIEIIKPINLRNFTRADGQKIAMTLFLCKSLNDNVQLSKEHTDFEWTPIEKCKEKLDEFFHAEVDLLIALLKM